MTRLLPCLPEMMDALLAATLPAGAEELATTSFLRANKPDWALELTTHTLPLDAEATEAVRDSAAALQVLRLDRDGVLERSRREVVIASLACADSVSGRDRAARAALHREGYRWAIEAGRWDAEALSGLERRYQTLADALGDLVDRAGRHDAEAFGHPSAAEELTRRWRVAVPREISLETLRHHANRLGVFAEPAAILHYFLYRLSGGPAEAPPA